MNRTHQVFSSASRPENVDPVAVVTERAAPERSAAIPKELEPDPESITDIVQGNFLVKLAVGIVILLAAFGLIMALG